MAFQSKYAGVCAVTGKRFGKGSLIEPYDRQLGTYRLVPGGRHIPHPEDIPSYRRPEVRCEICTICGTQGDHGSPPFTTLPPGSRCCDDCA